LVKEVTLRPVEGDDLAIFFEQQLDPVANYMAAFTSEDPADREAFDAHWAKILGDDRTFNRTILLGRQVAGHIASFERFGQPEIGYWLGKAFWGKGIATQALALFLGEVTGRPLYARAVKDNLASIRVLEKCGFKVVGEDSGYAHARGGDVEEYILKLEADE
jgi:RimJ/RimL family protein N-acetyltransferase